MKAMNTAKTVLLGTIATALVGAQISVWSDHDKTKVVEGPTQTLRGHIMPLQEYFGQTAAPGSASFESPYRSSTSGSTDSKETRTSDGLTSSDGAITPKQNSTQPSSLDSTPSSSGLTAKERPPGVYTPSLTDKNSPGSTLSGANWAGQPIVFVVSSTTSGSLGQDAVSGNPASPKNDLERDVAGSRASAVPSGVAGQAFLLVCNPQDHAKMTALSSVQDNRSYPNGKVENRGGAALGNQSTEPALNRDSTGTPTRQDPLGTVDRSASDSSVVGKRAHCEVKVTGKVMHRGGLQAIQVASIEGADSSGIGTSDSSKTEKKELEPVPDPIK